METSCFRGVPSRGAVLGLVIGGLHMDLERRAFLRNAAQCVVAATAITTFGTTFLPSAADATPLTAGKALTNAMESYVEKTQAVTGMMPTVRPRRRRRRRWTCWW